MDPRAELRTQNTMTASEECEVVDLTSSFTLVDHCTLSNVVIELDTDDSFTSCGNDSRRRRSNRIIKTATNGKRVSEAISETTSSVRRKSKKFGDCPICWDELGSNPLGSTKCGHVFCLKCLEASIKIEKRCPTCRCSLKGASAYHPLYLSKH